MQLSATGSTITLSENGTPRISVNDTTLTGGTTGMLVNAIAPVANWAAGSILPGTVSVGGNLSGLSSGVLALQDNGGDTINLSGNGTFTFPILLSQGAAYNVTVETEPSGQICSVTNGTGTVNSASVTNIAVACTASSASGATDGFQRPNASSLGADWSAMTDGGMAISSDQAIGASSSGDTGDIWTSDSFTSDQYSEVVVGSTPLTGTQWVGTAVRAQQGGQDAYVGIYWWNSGNPELEVFLRDNGNWSALGSWNTGGALPAGTQLQLTVVGDSLSFTVNGIQRVGVSDDTLTGGDPGIMANGVAQLTAWSGGNSGFQVNYQSTSSGIQSYSMLSANDGHGPQTLRVVQPTNPAPGVAHNFLIVLPVETGLGQSSGTAWPPCSRPTRRTSTT